MSQKRVNIFINGSDKNGQVFPILKSFEDLLKEISEQFGSNYTSLYNAQGFRIQNINLIRDNEILYASKGEDFIKIREKCSNSSQNFDNNWVKLNVGGQIFYTSRSTLTRDSDSMLAKMFDPELGLSPGCQDDDGAYLIDRDPKYFRQILNFLRTGQLHIDPDINPQGLYSEAQFFGLTSCLEQVKEILQKNSNPPLCRRDIIKLIAISQNSKLNVQGANLEGIDLSQMDLKNSNFKYAQMKGSNLSFCNFENVDLSGAILDDSLLLGSQLPKVNLERSSCINCNFSPGNVSAEVLQAVNMEEANLKNAILRNSNLTGGKADLSNCDLKYTILAGSCLENSFLNGCDLTGSDLHLAKDKFENLAVLAAELNIKINPLQLAQAFH